MSEEVRNQCDVADPVAKEKASAEKNRRLVNELRSSLTPLLERLSPDVEPAVVYPLRSR